MKINNQKEIAFAMYGFFLLIFLDILFLVFSKHITSFSKNTVYACFLVILLFCIWRIFKLKIFSMEASDHIFSIKYTHPLKKSRKPALEVPINKIVSFKTEKGIINYVLVVSLSTKRGIRNFYYEIGQLPENQFERFKSISEYVKTIHFNEKDGLKTTY